MPGPINRHDKPREGALTRRYLRMRDDDPSYRDEIDAYPYVEEVDDYWDPWYVATPLDFHLQQMFEQVLSVAFTPSVADFLSEAARGAWALTPLPELPATAANELADALHAHLDVAISRATRQDYLERLRRAGTLDDLRTAVVKTPVLGRWLSHQRGPAVMALVLAPFWIRPLSAWSPPEESNDLDAVTASLVDHLFVRYPLPKPLYHAWMGSSLPALKWACWTVLLGQGASLHRAAPRFGWYITSRFTQHLLAAPAELGTVEAVMWAEVARLGGSSVEHARLCAHRAYRIDPTAAPAAEADHDRWDAHDERPNVLFPATNTTPGFWRATVTWLVHHRDALSDDTCDVILDWANHRHTEDLAHNRSEDACFSWRGREPAAVLPEATRYRNAFGARIARAFGYAPMSWRARGWDWQDQRGDVLWSIRELTNDSELFDEGQAMHHCVGSYAYSCARGQAAIFSVKSNDTRRATVQLDPSRRRIVQARGPRNRPCDREELELLERWLAALPAT